MNKKTTVLGLLLTVTTLLLKADDILDYLADYIEKQNWHSPQEWDSKKLQTVITAKDHSPYAQELGSALSSELSADKKSLLIDSFKGISRKNKEIGAQRTTPSLGDKFELKKKKQYINNLLFIDSGKP